MRKLIILSLLAISLVSCQFSETMVMNQDGSGIIKITVNLSKMMALGGKTLSDSAPMKIDTIINIKQFLEEKKDSISKLSAAEQHKLKKLKNFDIEMKINSETSELIYDISTKFNDISQANNMLNGLEQVGNILPHIDSNTKVKKEEDSPEVVGVNYSFEKGVFKRDAYIIDEKLHQEQTDSLEKVTTFMEGSNYTLNYTFPKRIKKVSNPDATFSADKKTVIVIKPFIEYLKNPDVLDLEVELEK